MVSNYITHTDREGYVFGIGDDGCLYTIEIVRVLSSFDRMLIVARERLMFNR